jgi:hypothetical protein
VPATQQVIVHGSLKVITVRQGFVGVSFMDGALLVLPPGRSILDSVTHAFAGFLPTGQQTLELEAVDGMTSDNVGLKFDAAICVQIVDAKKAIMALSTTADGAREALAAGSYYITPSLSASDADACRHLGLFYRYLPNLRAADGAALNVLCQNCNIAFANDVIFKCMRHSSNFKTCKTIKSKYIPCIFKTSERRYCANL